MKIDYVVVSVQLSEGERLQEGDLLRFRRAASADRRRYEPAPVRQRDSGPASARGDAGADPRPHAIGVDLHKSPTPPV